MRQKSPREGGQVLWSITFILEAFYESVSFAIELELSAAVRADNNLNKVYSFIEVDLLLLRTVSLIH